MNPKKSVSRRQFDQQSFGFSYDPLEPRQLLAVTFGPEPLPVYGPMPLSVYGGQPAENSTTSISNELQLNSLIDLTNGTSLITQLTSPVPMQERLNLLHEQLGMGKFDSLRLTSLKRDQLGFAHLKYQQFHRGIEVMGGEYTVHIKEQQVVSVSGNFVEIATPTFQTKLTEAQALDHALEFVGADSYIWQVEDSELPGADHIHDEHEHHGHAHHVHGHDDHEIGLPTGELVYVAGRDPGTVLTYKFDIYALEPSLSRQNIFVDAASGEIVEVQDQIHTANVAANGTSLYNGTVNFTADLFTGGVRLRETTTNPTLFPDVETYDLNNGTNYGAATDIVSPTTSFTATDVHTGVQAHYGAEQTILYFALEHGRNSYDDAGSTMLSYVSYGTNYANAFWDGTRMTYGDGNAATGGNWNPLVSLDIVGHEVAHGVTGSSAGLVYSYESGALNESFSDIFGEAIELYATGTNDWLMGEDIGVNPGSALRSMSNPPAKGDPDTYLGINWHYDSSDNGGVHTNSGVQNKWFYILSEGEAGVNDHGQTYNVTGIGIADAEQIAYRNLTVYLTSSSQYIDARDGAIQSAIDLFGANSQQHLSTIDAWDAVGVGGSFIDLAVNSVDNRGSSVYQGSVSNTILGSGVVDTISIDLDANQKMSVSVSGANGMVPSIEIRDPADIVIASGTAANFDLTLQNAAISSSGTYKIIVAGDAGSSGPYDLDVLLNASFELESNGGTDNDSLANAENINDSALVVGLDSSIDRLAAVANLDATQVVFDGDDFETGSLDGDWATSSSHVDGRIVVTSSFGAQGSGNSLFMDVDNTNTFNLNEAVWTVDLTGMTAANLNFYHAEWGDETHVLPASFTGSENGDGVAISADGTNWFTVLTDTNQAAGVWDFVTIDLAAEASAAGISLGANFQVKFQQYDNWVYSSDGRAYDEISITTPQSSSDWFAFDVAAGQSVSLAATMFDGAGTVQVDLHDASGTLVLNGAAGTNVSSYISQYANAGGAATFYAVVSGNDDIDYNLIVSRGADFDFEPNDVTPQDISGQGGVFGFVTTIGQVSAEPDTVAAETVIDTTFPGVTLSENVASGSIYAADATFGAPTGSNVFAPTATAASGFRDGDNELRADFAILQSFVSIDVGSDDTSDVAWLRAYNSSGTLLDEVTSGSVASGGSETISISRPSADIAYVISAGLGGDITPLDNLVYQVANPNDDFYAIAAVANDQFTFDAFLPGLGPNLFNNPLDTGAGSALRMELRDPNGDFIALDSASISHTALLTGDYQLRVFADTGSGEYFVEHWYNHAPDAVTDSESTDEDTMFNIDVLFNDGDVDGDTYSVDSVTNPSNGTAVLNVDGTVDYTPADDFFGNDSFEYVLIDEHGAESTGTVNITVNSINDAPTDISISVNSISENTDTSSGAVEIGTLTASDIDSTAFTYGLVAGAGDADNSSFEIVGDKLQVKQGVILDFENQPQYSVRVEVSDGDLTFEKQILIDVTNQLEVELLSIGDGTDQRSMVTQLVIYFDEIVTISSGAFSLIQRGGTGGPVGLNPESISNTTGKSVVTLTFNGSFVNSGSLVDGNYELTIDGSNIESTSTGQLLDGDEDGIAGGSHITGDTEADKFFRFFGDINGDRSVSVLDLFSFRKTFGKSDGDTDFDDRFDVNDDGSVSVLDLFSFRNNFGDTLNF